MAVARVFATAELVEKILLQLPTKDLLLSKRVCKTFQNVHEEFISIKKALFLVPGAASDTGADARFPNHKYPFSSSALKRMWNRAGYDVQLPETTLHGGVALNPLLVMRLLSPRLAVARENYRDLHRDPIHLWPGLMFAASDASCNGMFLTQPPLQVMNTVVYEPGRGPHHADDKMFVGAEKLSELAAEWRIYFAKKGPLKKPAEVWGVGLMAEMLEAS